MAGSCDICNRQFIYRKSIRRHKRTTGHCVCQICGKILNSTGAVERHVSEVHKWTRPQCFENLRDKDVLQNYRRNLSRCYFGDCNRAFNSETTLATHLSGSAHSTQFRCCHCDRNFINSSSLKQHLRDKVHKRHLPAHKCRRCARKFDTQGALLQHAEIHTSSPKTKCQRRSRELENSAALHQHLESLTHRPLGDLRCVVGSPCHKKFSSLSALLHHLESGSCRSGMNRAALNDVILSHDKDELIAKSKERISNILLEVNKRLEYSSGCDSSSSCSTSGTMILTPPSDISSIFALTPNSLNLEKGLSDWLVLVSQSAGSKCPFCPHSGRERLLRITFVQPPTQSLCSSAPRY